MTTLNPAKLHVQFKGDATPDGPIIPRCYTLTHSDSTGDLFLTVATTFDAEALKGWQTRLMRDEVLAEWRTDSQSNPSLHLTCHVSGRWFNFGPAGWRYSMFQHHMRQVLQALRYGDRSLYQTHPDLDRASILVHFEARQKQYNKVEEWGSPDNYRI